MLVERFSDVGVLFDISIVCQLFCCVFWLAWLLWLGWLFVVAGFLLVMMFFASFLVFC
ncbi:uncharacterized protein (DUF58 family) [Trueperella pyogenes]|nr:uncharacterized protein (DUF58 family) [Trueperella pyogenes]